MYIKCVILRLFSTLSHRVGALQISIIIIIIFVMVVPNTGGGHPQGQSSHQRRLHHHHRRNRHLPPGEHENRDVHAQRHRRQHLLSGEHGQDHAKHAAAARHCCHRVSCLAMVFLHIIGLLAIFIETSLPDIVATE